MKMPARYARLYQRRSKRQMCSATGESPKSLNLVNPEYWSVGKGFPMNAERLIRRVPVKAKETQGLHAE
jgi:hypothetical protein